MNCLSEATLSKNPSLHRWAIRDVLDEVEQYHEEDIGTIRDVLDEIEQYREDNPEVAEPMDVGDGGNNAY